MNFNVNDKVRVKLTDHGRQALRRRHADLWDGISPHQYEPPKEDAEGWSEWQMWDLMESLGHMWYMGGPPPFDTTIQLVDRHAKRRNDARS